MQSSCITTLFPLLSISLQYMCCGFFREGQVSREEITAYFLRASVICSKLGLGFVHNFQETTYMKPTFCDNCSGFVRKHKPRWCCFLKKNVIWVLLFYVYSHKCCSLSFRSQLWGVIKQGYRCKGEYGALTRVTLVSLAKCQLTQILGEVHSVLWGAGEMECGFSLRCMLLVEPCSTWQKETALRTTVFFPLPRPSKDLRTICLLDSKHAKTRVWELHLQNR